MLKQVTGLTVLAFMLSGDTYQAAAQAKVKNDPAPAGFNPRSISEMVDFFNARPTPGNAYRVLFIGDSLTLHGPAAGLWTYYAGMAASDTRHDFVHLAAGHMQALLPKRPLEIFYDDGGGKIGAMLRYAEMHPELKPDLIIVQGGENDEFSDDFRTQYRGLLGVFAGVPRLVLSDWANASKRDFEREEAAKRHLGFIDLVIIKAEAETTGNGGPFHHDGVAWHPNDHGMERIAEGIGKMFDARVLPVL